MKIRNSGFDSKFAAKAAGWALCLAALAIPACVSGQAQTQRNISVIVTDTAGNGLADATITVAGTSMRATSDASGKAEFRNVDWGPQLIQVRKLGYGEVNQSVVVPAGGSITTTITLQRVPLSLDKVVVRDKSDKPARLAWTNRFDEFYRRRKRETGTFLTREDIDERSPGRAVDLYTGIAGVQVSYRGTTPRLYFPRCQGRVEIFVDGMRLNEGMSVIMNMPPGQIEAIEVYHSAASVPPQFIPRPNYCAAILVWTRYN